MTDTHKKILDIMSSELATSVLNKTPLDKQRLALLSMIPDVMHTVDIQRRSAEAMRVMGATACAQFIADMADATEAILLRHLAPSADQGGN